MFETLTMAPPDPILGLTEAFKKDPNPEKINLGVGVYLDENGKVPTLATVREAARRILEANASTSYLPMDGLGDYNKLVQELLLGTGHAAPGDGRVVTVQTPGGTGALRVAADFVKRVTEGTPTIWVSDETWANHGGIFGAAGLDVRPYPYYDPETKDLRFEAMVEAIGKIPRGDMILLHGACHNPTGIDPTAEQWVAIADAVQKQGLLPLIDFAYQGLAEGIGEDAVGVRLFARPGREALIASSFSKNFSLYNERVGALTAIGRSAEEVEKALSHVKMAIRTNYSNPPRQGAALVATVLGDAGLRKQWEAEVAGIRGRINQMRTALVGALADKGIDRDFSFIQRQRGMFSYSGLTPDQVAALRSKYAIYIVKSGRINVAGITSRNLGRLVDAIADVLESN
jgi:aspartate/tyrosine/aromatic aminotransferase